MTKLAAQSIRKRVGMVTPFCERTKLHGRSYGLGPAGYDIRLRDGMWLWPLWGRIGISIEKFDMPNDVSAEVKDKSTNARMFVFVQNTVIEPGWRGHLTLELTRGLPWPIYLKPGTPIAQVRFEPLDEATDMPYPDDAKYQDAGTEPQPAILEQI